MSDRVRRSYMKCARKRANLTQKQMAPLVGICLRLYVSIEGGEADLKPGQLEKFAQALDENLWALKRDEQAFQADRRRYRRQKRREAATAAAAGE